MTTRSRVAAVLTAVTMHVALGVDVAWAHGADNLAYQGVRGPYLVSVFDARRTGTVGEAEYRIVLTQDPGDGRNGEGAPVLPITQASVQAIDDDGRRHRAAGIGSVYFLVLEDRDHRLAITIDGLLGQADLALTVHALQPSGRNDGAPPALLSVAVATGLGGLGIVAVRRHRHRRVMPRDADAVAPVSGA